MKHTKIDTDRLRQAAALSQLTPPQLEYLALAMVEEHFAPGEFIFLEGEAARGLWFVVEGRVKIVKHSLNGRILGLCLMNPGKCFGACPLFNTSINPASAMAVDEVSIVLLPQDQYLNMSKHDVTLTEALLRIYSQALAHLARLAEGLGHWSTQDRINDCLLTYVERDAGLPTVFLTHDKLAMLASTGREVVTRHLGHLEKLGIIKNEPGCIRLLDISALRLPCLNDAG
jgi:CRP/FNR family transcriptional regulator